MIRVHITLDPRETGGPGASGGVSGVSGMGGMGGSAGSISELEQIDLLTSRICDGEASPGDWAAFRDLAQRVPGAWQGLAEAQRQHQALCVSVGVALNAADRVELARLAPLARVHAAHADERDLEHGHHHHRHGVDAWARVRAWGGWAAAAAVALAWVSGQQLGVTTAVGPRGTTGDNAGLAATVAPALPQVVNAAGVGGIPGDWTSESAADAYLKLGQREGRVVGEVPQRLLVDSRPLGRGQGYEVTYVRQFIEKVRVPDLMRVGIDEQGQAVPVRVTRPSEFGEVQ